MVLPFREVGATFRHLAAREFAMEADVFLDKDWRTRRRYQVVINAVTAFLDPKFKLYAAAGCQISDEKGNLIRMPIGYLAGFTQMAMREKKLEHKGPYAFGTLKLVFQKIWGSEIGNKCLDCWIGNMNDAQILAGYKLGVDDCMAASRLGLGGLLRLGECWRHKQIMLHGGERTLFALERRFELRVLRIFMVGLSAILIVAIVQRDWWLLGICLVALFFNGLIGGRLHKNRHKSFWQLAAGSSVEQDTLSEEPENEDFYMIARSAIKFQGLVAVTAALIAYHFNQRWWIVVTAALVSWLASVILSFVAFWKIKPSGEYRPTSSPKRG
jgi:hypothetical protein